MKKQILATLIIFMAISGLYAQNDVYMYDKGHQCQLSTVANDNRSFTYTGGRCVNGYLSGQVAIKMYRNDSLYYTFTGNVDHGLFNGYAKVVYSDGTIFEGIYQNGARFGKGTYIWPDGRKYYGDWKNGDQEGYGVFTNPNGYRYEGDYKAGKATGIAHIRYSNGATYDGECVDGDRDGIGSAVWTNGDKYKGQWKNDKLEGMGTYTFANGAKYTGELKGGKNNGKGVQYYANGDRYDGDWVDDNHEGIGTFYYANGNKYEGEWKNGYKDGTGTYTWPSGVKFTGSYTRGKIDGKKGTIYYPDNSHENFTNDDPISEQSLYNYYIRLKLVKMRESKRSDAIEAEPAYQHLKKDLESYNNNGSYVKVDLTDDGGIVITTNNNESGSKSIYPIDVDCIYTSQNNYLLDDDFKIAKHDIVVYSEDMFNKTQKTIVKLHSEDPETDKGLLIQLTEKIKPGFQARYTHLVDSLTNVVNERAKRDAEFKASAKEYSDKVAAMEDRLRPSFSSRYSCINYLQKHLRLYSENTSGYFNVYDQYLVGKNLAFISSSGWVNAATTYLPYKNISSAYVMDDTSVWVYGRLTYTAKDGRKWTLDDTLLKAGADNLQDGVSLELCLNYLAKH